MDHPLAESHGGPDPGPPSVEPLDVAPAGGQHFNAASLGVIGFFVSFLLTAEITVLAEAQSEAGKNSAPKLVACVVHARAAALSEAIFGLFDHRGSSTHVHELEF